MGLDELKPGNTKRTKDTAISAFMAFVKYEQVAFDYVKRCIEENATGKCFVSVLDMFGMYLAFNAGKNGKTLTRNTAMQYFRQCKMWLFELFPVQQHIVEAKLLSMGKTLDSFCMKRDGKVINKALRSSKRDLKKVDIVFILSVDAAQVFFVRFIRMKTSEEQGISLFPDADFVTFPLYAVAIALITQAAPSVTRIDNLPEIPVGAAVTLAPATPLVEVLNHREGFTALASAAPKSVAAEPKTAASVPAIYSHVNRLLDRVAPPAESFNYIFNTSKEDHMISKALSGYSTEAEVKAMNLTAFDAETKEKINAFQRSLFTTCYKMESSMYNLSQQVADVLTAYLILYYPRMKELQADGLAVMLMKAAVVNAGASVAELLAWSSHLAVCGKENPTQATKHHTRPRNRATRASSSSIKAV
ncbi:unnamed protein product [Phytophthora fragariaefolia]|uniref:Unnamed protein product n=1 Tax=Phytophthora fragariaefolia TaxID=1490495 RepID=A0A9W6U4I7_9STRA|nr:unnamed protein product [Phytophthora fragariaefolia]